MVPFRRRGFLRTGRTRQGLLFYYGTPQGTYYSRRSEYFPAGDRRSPRPVSQRKGRDRRRVRERFLWRGGRRLRPAGRRGRADGSGSARILPRTAAVFENAQGGGLWE